MNPNSQRETEDRDDYYSRKDRRNLADLDKFLAFAQWSGLTIALLGAPGLAIIWAMK